MNKLEMAHDYLKVLLTQNTSRTVGEAVETAYALADAMQAEADKRKSKPELPSLQQTFIDGVEQPRYAPSCDEWQPDWSQAPEWANWWAMDGFSEKANWYIDKPYLDDDSKVESEWNIDLRANAKTYIQAPSFDYQGNWQDSLRKRP